ncbi:unnamed protein product [Hapterophycus canaliculatus]
MGAQYSTGTLSPDWKGWLEEGCSLENIRAIYNDFRVLVSSRKDDDVFFVSHRDFLQVFADVANFPPPRQGTRRGTNDSSLVDRTCARSIDAERSRRIHLDKCFSCFDVLERSRVPSGVVWGGLALMTGAPELSKVKFIVGMYDGDRDGMLNQTELRMAMTACATGFCRLHRIGPPPDGTLHSLAQEAFLHQQAVVAGKLGARKRAEEAHETDNIDRSVSPAASTSAPVDSSTTPDAIIVAASIPALAVSTFCCANSRCRNFLKGVGSAGSADLLLLYRHEHELLRELAEVDSALDVYDRKAENVASAAKIYAIERGGDAPKLVVDGARVQALAEKWGVGRLLQPAAVRELLKQKAVAMGGRASGGAKSLYEESPHALATKEGQADEAAYPLAEEVHSSSRDSGGGARRIPWKKSLISPNLLASPRTSGGGGFHADNESRKSATALGWSDGFATMPELQMQVLMEVGNHVRAAARKREAAQRE